MKTLIVSLPLASKVTEIKVSHDRHNAGDARQSDAVDKHYAKADNHMNREIAVAVDDGVGDVASLRDVDTGQDSVMDKAQVMGDAVRVTVCLIDSATS